MWCLCTRPATDLQLPARHSATPHRAEWAHPANPALPPCPALPAPAPAPHIGRGEDAAGGAQRGGLALSSAKGKAARHAAEQSQQVSHAGNTERHALQEQWCQEAMSWAVQASGQRRGAEGRPRRGPRQALASGPSTIAPPWSSAQFGCPQRPRAARPAHNGAGAVSSGFPAGSLVCLCECTDITPEILSRRVHERRTPLGGRCDTARRAPGFLVLALAWHRRPAGELSRERNAS